MKVFISHSDNRSKTLAQKVEWFVRNLIPATDPWISTGIEKGSRWESAIAQNLEDTHVGIVCLTSENLNARWLLFESGALSKRLDGKVATLFLDVTAAQIEPPLSQFQHTKAEREDVLQLMETINKRVADVGERPRRDDDLRGTFDKFWPDLEATISDLRSHAPSAAAPARKPEDMLAELLDLARANLRQGWMQEKTLKMLHQVYRAVLGHAAPSLEHLRKIVESGSWVGIQKGAVIPPADPLRSSVVEPLVSSDSVTAGQDN